MSFYGTVLNNYPESYEPNLGKVQQIEEAFDQAVENIENKFNTTIQEISNEFEPLKETITTNTTNITTLQNNTKLMVESNEFEIKTYTVDLRIMHQSYKTTITFEATTEHRNIIPLSATIRWDTSKTIPTQLSSYPKIWTQIYRHYDNPYAFDILYEMSEEDFSIVEDYSYGIYLELCFMRQKKW